jgi:hypothetical protein
MHEQGSESFFDRYSAFFDTSIIGNRAKSGQKSKRLHYRYQAIVECNRSLFRGARVLDLASHDGRWTLAALDAGAAHATGIEGRQKLVNAACDTFSKYGVDPQTYEFQTADLFEALPKLAPGRFDLILCLGFLYHTVRHYEIFAQFYRLRPKHVILDTRVVKGIGPIVRFKREGHQWPGATIATTEGLPGSLVGVPNHEMLALLSEHFRFRLRVVEWHTLGVSDWTHLEDYQRDERRTYVLDRLGEH